MSGPARRGFPWWAVAAVVVVLLPATGMLPADDARTLAERTLPILLFLAALTVVAETSAGAGLFDAAAGLAARAARGRRVVLWLLVVVLATLSTAVLSLDTTAVLLTPVVVALARHTRTSPVPFALAVLALANTASLVLPVSNLTNLLADHAIRRAGASFLPLMWAPALVAIVVTVAILAVRDRRHLGGTYEPQDPSPAPDRTLLLLAAAVTGLMAVGFVAGLPPAPLATGAAVVLLVATRVRHRPWPVPPSQLVPWRTLVVVLGLFVAVETAHAHGLGALLHDLAGDGDGAGELLRLAGVAALASNGVNNLPAYLALEPAAAGDPLRLAALLIGTGAGPLLTPWGSLATVLWWHRCRQVMLDVPARTIVLQGALLAPPVVVLAVLALAVAH